ncbi:winged helix-turn-helix domain-containing protein [Streptomyces sp. HUAS MG91]|uniref:Winged helix-turn-helix domain-containing protein n=1 Tax=Streptomyces tabacisoli TaxID=3156398 RepID=A0AAU8IV34_9ACTN
MSGKSDPTSKATSEEIADDLRARIKNGLLKVGDRLPTQAKLAEEFGVERGAVRQALQRLQADGLLTNVSRGSPPQVAETAVPRQTGDLTARGILGPRLVKAFESPEVCVDVACLTAETLMTALGEPLNRVYSGVAVPDSVRLRVLLPRLDQNLDYPSPREGWGHDKDLDAAVKLRSSNQRESQRTVLRSNIHGLRAMGVDARIEFRYTYGTPSRKAYLLNRREVLIGHYVPEPFERDVAGYGDDVPLCDVQGFSTPMFVFASSAGSSEANFVEAEQTMFDGVWEHVARDRP